MQTFVFDDRRANNTHIGSGWKPPIGKLLTDKRIEHYQKLGFYGDSGILELRRLDAKNKTPKTKKAKAELTKKELMRLFA